MSVLPYSDEYYMRLALQEASYALRDDEVPVGAIVVVNNRIIGRGYNQTERLKDVTAHAEMLAITAAANYLASKYLEECTLYVTLEPCLMCAAAMRWARIGRLVYGANDEKGGYTLIGRPVLHPKTTVTRGILGDECGALLTEFFRGKRGGTLV
ncbi:MAG: nucleoside deaminase [Chitinophagales bacterium]|nr:nucleoside deaminase [Chitinophagales bacterium]MDW8418865.1 nucleoside deaminase [Chitinophagales bacterium]